ncbi:uncharacterized mitochondrial protein AtMg00810-like [Telopea speciosissima]|uniref:uncharacterized mitochondrial protein AtMg00810-like n=1 Tax=Telopea speciosissima TaxID=54955 RepID=UPI001CC6767C|nr:uncharacterized mitochondrial protein AtMg00810-like [Telopea speciosissima]
MPDTALFVHSGTPLLYILVYVDDIIVTGSRPTAVQQLITSLGTEFAIKDLGSLYYFLGIEAVRTADSLSLSKTKYTLDLPRKAKMEAAKPMPTPSSTTTLSHARGDSFHDPTLYCSIVDALQYLTLTRPDIAFSFNKDQIADISDIITKGLPALCFNVLRYTFYLSISY